MQNYKLVNIHAFPGFYHSALDGMLDDEIKQTFYYDDHANSNVPDAIYGGSGVEYVADFSNAHLELAKQYCAAWFEQFNSETGFNLEWEYESYSSPRFYNYETDRLFTYVSDKSILHLFKESKANKHEKLAEHIATRFTSCSGFISSYPNDLESWLEKPVLEWDHNELGTLLDAVLAIHCSESDIERDFDTWRLMESFRCNGGLSNAVWDAMPAKIREFADLQREYGKPVDFELWLETGNAYPEGTNRDEIVEAGELPPLPYPHTISMKL